MTLNPRLTLASYGKAYGVTILASAMALLLTTGCSTKNYVRSQTGPLIQQTNELDSKAAQDHNNITDTDQRAQAGIARADAAASTADQHAQAAGSLPIRRSRRRRMRPIAWTHSRAWWPTWTTTRSSRT